jgi:hypothetical protein
MLLLFSREKMKKIIGSSTPPEPVVPPALIIQIPIPECLMTAYDASLSMMMCVDDGHKSCISPSLSIELLFSVGPTEGLSFLCFH